MIASQQRTILCIRDTDPDLFQFLTESRISCQHPHGSILTQKQSRRIIVNDVLQASPAIDRSFQPRFQRHHLSGQHIPKRQQRHRSTVVIPLNPFTANLFQKIEMFLRLHTLGKGMNAKTLGHTDNTGDDIPAALIKTAEEIHIQLDQIERKPIQ